MGTGLSDPRFLTAGSPTGCMQWQVLRAGQGAQTSGSSILPNSPPPTCQLLKLQGRAHREGPGCQGAWAPAL